MNRELPGVLVVGFSVIFASVPVYGEDYCNKNCQEVYHNCTNPEFQLCLDAQSESDCGANTSGSLAFNVILGILALIGIIAILIRCCLFVRLLGGKNNGKLEEDKEQEAQQPLQNNSSHAAV